jgi:hypothetical protein
MLPACRAARSRSGMRRPRDRDRCYLHPQRAFGRVPDGALSAFFAGWKPNTCSRELVGDAARSAASLGKACIIGGTGGPDLPSVARLSNRFSSRRCGPSKALREAVSADSLSSRHASKPLIGKSLLAFCFSAALRRSCLSCNLRLEIASQAHCGCAGKS